MKLIPFTFHNVSINSGYLLYESKPYPHYLHSIMYLLIRWHNRNIIVSTKFTFHNVSINSLLGIPHTRQMMQFTFHNVSINSDNGEDRMKAVQHLHSIMYLLIRLFSLLLTQSYLYLHSIMYLLIHNSIYIAIDFMFNLHSIMYLLIQVLKIICIVV